MRPGEWVRSRREEILAEWKRAAQKLPSAEGLPQTRLLDHVPTLLDRIADAVDASDGGEATPRGEAAERHALDRLESGFDLGEVVLELSALRESIMTVMERSEGVAAAGASARLLHRGIDQAIGASVTRYVQNRDRVLEVLDRISAASLEAEDFEELLHRLATAFREHVPAADTIAILMRDGDVLSLRAAHGLEKDVRRGLSIRIGEGFAGRVAAARRPLQLSSASTDPLVASEGLRERGIRALYGVPLLAEQGELIGVAHMGSITASSFSQVDRVLFASMAARATAGIRLHRLYEEARRHAEKVQESERRFRETFDHAAVGIAHIALAGAWIRLNAGFCRILGYSHDALRARRLQDLPHPDDLDKVVDRFRRVLAGETFAQALEARAVRGDGAVVWVSLSMALVRDAEGRPLYIVASAEDVTGRRKLRDRLAFLAEVGRVLGESLEIDRLLDAVTRVLVPTVADWCVVELGETVEELGDRSATAHREPEKIAILDELRRRTPRRRDVPAGPAVVLRTGEPEVIPEVTDELMRQVAIDERQLEGMRRLGIRSFICVPLRHRGRTVGVLWLAMAESGRLLSEEDLPLAEEIARRAAAAVENARVHEEAQQGARLRDRILAVVSHDLRDPLNAIHLASTLLRESPTTRADPTVCRHVEVIQRQGQRACRLVADLLDVACIQAGKLSVDLAEHALRPIVDEAVAEYEPLARTKGVHLRGALDLGGARVRCDAQRIRQVLSNLLGNAVKFSRPGDTVEVRARVRGEEALVSVTDTGPGIASESLGRVFDLYWKGDAPESGTGLGLFITKGIMDSHGGRIDVESRPGAGATFSVALPLARAVEPEGASPHGGDGGRRSGASDQDS